MVTHTAQPTRNYDVCFIGEMYAPFFCNFLLIDEMREVP